MSPHTLKLTVRWGEKPLVELDGVQLTDVDGIDFEGDKVKITLKAEVECVVDGVSTYRKDGTWSMEP